MSDVSKNGGKTTGTEATGNSSANHLKTVNKTKYRNYFFLFI